MSPICSGDHCPSQLVLPPIAGAAGMGIGAPPIASSPCAKPVLPPLETGASPVSSPSPMAPSDVAASPVSSPSPETSPDPSRDPSPDEKSTMRVSLSVPPRLSSADDESAAAARRAAARLAPSPPGGRARRRRCPRGVRPRPTWSGSPARARCAAVRAVSGSLPVVVARRSSGRLEPLPRRRRRCRGRRRGVEAVGRAVGRAAVVGFGRAPPAEPDEFGIPSIEAPACRRPRRRGRAAAVAAAVAARRRGVVVGGAGARAARRDAGVDWAAELGARRGAAAARGRRR